MSHLTIAGPCPPKATCTVVGGGEMQHWVSKEWVTQPKTTGTVVVVQIVNTVLGTTRFSTIQENVPSGFVPPLTNAAGTKIAKTTYVRRGTTLTATLTYPTPRLFFDETFRVQGDYLLRSTSGSRCVIGANQTWDMLAEPQPSWGYGTKWDLSAEFDPSDPLGWNHGFNEGSANSNPVGMDDLIDLFPDDNPSMPHSVVKSCSSKNLPAPYVLKPEPNWRVVASTSVIYEGVNSGKGTTSVASTTSTGGRGGTTAVDTATPASGTAGRTTGSASVPTGTSTTAGSPTTSASMGSRTRGRIAWPGWAALWMGCIVVVTLAV